MRKFLMILMCIFIIEAPIIANAQEDDFWYENPEDVADNWYPSDAYLYNEIVNFGQESSTVSAYDRAYQYYVTQSDEYIVSRYKVKSFGITDEEMPALIRVAEERGLTEAGEAMSQLMASGSVTVYDMDKIYDSYGIVHSHVSRTEKKEEMKSNKNDEQGPIKEDETSENGEITDIWNEIKRVEASCEKEGYYILENDSTGEKRTEVIPTIEHEEGEAVITKAPGLFASGQSEVKCIICDTVLHQDEVKSGFENSSLYKMGSEIIARARKSVSHFGDEE